MDHSRTLPADMLEIVAVKALRPFEEDDRLITVGDEVQVPKHRASYLVFRQLVEWV